MRKRTERIKYRRGVVNGLQVWVGTLTAYEPVGLHLYKKVGNDAEQTVRGWELYNDAKSGNDNLGDESRRWMCAATVALTGS